MTTNEWPSIVTILVEVQEPLPPLVDGDHLTILTDDVAFSGLFRGVITQEQSE